jgi:predicted amidophosphoribosyltransferase
MGNQGKDSAWERGAASPVEHASPRYYGRSGFGQRQVVPLGDDRPEGVLLVAIVETHPEHIDGPWIEGFVLDRHVISSRPIGYAGEYMQFETTRSPLGELVYQLKYRNGPLDDIVETAVAFVTERWSGSIDCVVPPPPSLHRTRQPAVLIAEGIAKSFGVPTLPNAAVKATATQQMKNVPLHERAPLLTAAIQAGTDSVHSRRVLLVDDLWETGCTLRRVAEVLSAMGASEIRALR